MAKPLHPGLVHFPLSFLLLSYALDLFHAASPSLPGAILAQLPPVQDFPRASYYLLCLGLVTAIPAVASGAQQAQLVMAKGGPFEDDGKGGQRMRPKAKAVFTHAATMDTMLLASSYLWWCKRGLGSATGELSEGWMMWAQGGLIAGFMFGGATGGSLTYNFGVGFSPLGGSKKTL